LKLLRKRFAIAGESHERMPRFKRGSPRTAVKTLDCARSFEDF